jgi:hypothetical protein
MVFALGDKWTFPATSASESSTCAGVKVVIDTCQMNFHCCLASELVFGDNCWIMLSELILWVKLVDDLATKFCRCFALPTQAFRIAPDSFVIPEAILKADSNDQVGFSYPCRFAIAAVP